MDRKEIELIEEKHKELIEIAKKYMQRIQDPEHDMGHIEDVILYTKKLLDTLKEELDKEVCIISAYWHDVGRVRRKEGHEKLSADMLKETMKELGYEESLIQKCYLAIKNHKWNMVPNTKEGLVIKDADKLAWLGMNRWKSCLEHHVALQEIIEQLPRLRNEILYFEESRKIYDQEILKLLLFFYKKYVEE